MVFPSAATLVLASASRYRKALLERLRLAFTICPADIDESPLPAEAPHATAERLATEKARSVALRYPGHLIIGSDQVATVDGRSILGKPETHDRAVEQLRRLSGRRVEFYTAVCLCNPQTGSLRSAMVPTTVEFRSLSLAAIEAYLAREQPYDCTGSAKIEGLGIVLVRRVLSEDPSALVGLPLIALQDLLAAEGVHLI